MISTGPSITHLAKFVNGYPFKPDDLGDDGLPVVRIRQLLDETAGFQFALPPAKAVFIGDGDIVFSWSATLAVRRWRRGRALLNQHLFRVEPVRGVDPQWFAYVVEVGIERLRPLMHGSAMTHITNDMLRSVTIRLPSYRQQEAVASFLDTETARIDALIAKQRRIVELLSARRVTVASYAVSGKLHGLLSLESSSLPWLDERPVHWKEVLLRLVARLGTGHTPSRDHPEWWIDCTVPWITTGEVQLLRSDRVEYINSTRDMISEIGLANSSAELHPANTVVLCRTASAGYSGIMRTPMATSQDFATWTCGPLLRPRFLLLCLRAMRQDLLGRLAMGSTHQTIYMPDIRSIRIPLPPLAEQDEIVDAAWSRFTKVDRLVTVAERQIRLLEERRQALIMAAVTGELPIPESVAS